MIALSCPVCRHAWDVAEDFYDQAAPCPACGLVVTVHQPAPAFLDDAQAAPAGANAGPMAQADIQKQTVSTDHLNTLASRAAGSPALPSLDDHFHPAQGPDELGRLGGFRLLKLLGQGGMGAVFLAEEVVLQRQVALKVMLRGAASQPGARQRFLREARAAAALKSDHVIHINQVGEDNGIPFLAMELLEGESLEDWLKRGLRPTTPWLLKLAEGLTLGLAAAHAQGLIHRDLKPSNIWLEAPQARVKLLDFGLARAVHEEVHLTRAGAIMGTPSYMSPEQARAEECDARSDLFSLGCVLYRVGTGRLPFQGASPTAVLTAIAVDDPPPVRKLNPDVPDSLAALIHRLLAKRREDRPESAQAVLEYLRMIELVQPRAPETVASPAVQPTAVEATPARRRWPRVAAAMLAIASGALLAPVIIRITGKDGKQTTIQVPDATSVEVEKDGRRVGEVLIPEEGQSSGFPALDPAWVTRVQTMAPKDQAEAIGEELRKRNRGFDGKLSPAVEQNQVIGLVLDAGFIRDLSPLRALKRLRLLDCRGREKQPGLLADLSPLKGMKLQVVRLDDTAVTDLSPLGGMPLNELSLNRTRVQDFSPLWGMPLEALLVADTKFKDFDRLKTSPLRRLQVSGTSISSLAPLKGLPLEQLSIGRTKVSDLSPLEGMALRDLQIYLTPVEDLAPLQGMALKSIRLQGAKVRDLSTLRGMPLQSIWVDDMVALRNAEVLRSINTLETINDQTPGEFWKGVERGEKPSKPPK